MQKANDEQIGRLIEVIEELNRIHKVDTKRVSIVVNNLNNIIDQIKALSDNAKTIDIPTLKDSIVAMESSLVSLRNLFTAFSKLSSGVKWKEYFESSLLSKTATIDINFLLFSFSGVGTLINPVVIALATANVAMLTVFMRMAALLYIEVMMILSASGSSFSAMLRNWIIVKFLLLKPLKISLKLVRAFSNAKINKSDIINAIINIALLLPVIISYIILLNYIQILFNKLSDIYVDLLKYSILDSVFKKQRGLMWYMEDKVIIPIMHIATKNSPGEVATMVFNMILLTYLIQIASVFFPMMFGILELGVNFRIFLFGKVIDNVFKRTQDIVPTILGIVRGLDITQIFKASLSYASLIPTMLMFRIFFTIFMAVINSIGIVSMLFIRMRLRVLTDVIQSIIYIINTFNKSEFSASKLSQIRASLKETLSIVTLFRKIYDQVKHINMSGAKAKAIYLTIGAMGDVLYRLTGLFGIGRDKKNAILDPRNMGRLLIMDDAFKSLNKLIRRFMWTMFWIGKLSLFVGATISALIGVSILTKVIRKTVDYVSKMIDTMSSSDKYKELLEKYKGVLSYILDVCAENLKLSLKLKLGTAPLKSIGESTLALHASVMQILIFSITLDKVNEYLKRRKKVDLTALKNLCDEVEDASSGLSMIAGSISLIAKIMVGAMLFSAAKDALSAENPSVKETASVLGKALASLASIVIYVMALTFAVSTIIRFLNRIAGQDFFMRSLRVVGITVMMTTIIFAITGLVFSANVLLRVVREDTLLRSFVMITVVITSILLVSTIINKAAQAVSLSKVVKSCLELILVAATLDILILSLIPFIVLTYTAIIPDPLAILTVTMSLAIIILISLAVVKLASLIKPMQVIKAAVTLILVNVVLGILIITLSLMNILLIMESATSGVSILKGMLFILLKVILFIATIAILSVLCTAVVPLMLPAILAFALVAVVLSILIVVLSLMNTLIIMDMAMGGLGAVVGAVAVMLKIIIFATALAGLALLAVLILPLLVPATISIVAMTIIVVSLVLIVALLNILAMIPLDIEAVREKIVHIMDCVKLILACAFGDTSQKSGNEESKGFIGLIINALGDVAKALLLVPTMLFITLSVFCMVVLAGMLFLLQKIEIDFTKVNLNVENIMAMIFGGTINGQRTVGILPMLRGDRLKKVEDKGNSDGTTAKYVVEASGSSFGLFDVIRSLMMFATLVMLIPAIGALFLVKHLLTKLAESEFKDPSAKVSEIMGAAEHLLDVVNGTPEGLKPEKSDNIFTRTAKKVAGTVVGVFGNLLDILKNLSSLGKLGSIMGNVMIVQSLAEALDVISKITFDATTVTNRVSQIMEGVSLVCAAVNDKSKSDDDYEISEDRIKNMNNSLDYISKLVESVNDVADKIDEAASAQISTLPNLISQTISTIDSINVGDNTNAKLDILDRIGSTIGKFTVSRESAKNTKDMVDNLVKFMDKVDKVELNKLKSTEQLMEHWTRLATEIKGNFKDLASAINEHISPAIDKLNDTMDGCTEAQQALIDLMEKEPTASQQPVQYAVQTNPNQNISKYDSSRMSKKDYTDIVLALNEVAMALREK